MQDDVDAWMPKHFDDSLWHPAVTERSELCGSTRLGAAPSVFNNDCTRFIPYVAEDVRRSRRLGRRAGAPRRDRGRGRAREPVPGAGRRAVVQRQHRRGRQGARSLRERLRRARADPRRALPGRRRGRAGVRRLAERTAISNSRRMARRRPRPDVRRDSGHPAALALHPLPGQGQPNDLGGLRGRLDLLGVIGEPRVAESSPIPSAGTPGCHTSGGTRQRAC